MKNKISSKNMFDKIKAEVRKKYKPVPWYLWPFLHGETERIHTEVQWTTKYQQKFVTHRYKGTDYLIKFGGIDGQ